MFHRTVGNKSCCSVDFLFMAGRPRIFETAEEMQGYVDGYFIQAEAKKEKITMSGLAIYLGFADRQSLYDYEKKEEFSCTIKMALLRVENAYEQALYNNSVAGPIFALKNMGWKDKQETDLNVSGGVTVNLVPTPGCDPIKDEAG